MSNLHPRRTIGNVTDPYTVGSRYPIGSRIGSSTLLSDRWRSYSPSSIYGTIGGRISDRWAGYITIGRDGHRPYLNGGLFYNSFYRNRCYPYAYRPSWYYHGYTPIWSYSHWYRPCYGYTYASVYYPYPYYYRNSYTDVYVYDYDDGYGDAYSSDAVFYGDGGSTTTHGETRQDYVTAPEAYDSTGGAPSYAESPRTADEQGEGARAGTPLDESEAGKYQDLTAPGGDTLIGQGNAAFAGGRYEEARRHYISAVMADERDGYAKFLYSLCNFAVGDYEVAGLSLRRALLTTPELVEYPPDARALYPDQAMLTGQLATLEKHVASNATDRNAPLLLGYLQFAVGEAQRAAATLEPLVAQDAEDTAAALVRDAALRAGKK